MIVNTILSSYVTDTCHDIYKDCSQKIQNDNYCSRPEAFEQCHKTCSFCDQGVDTFSETNQEPGKIWSRFCIEHNILFKKVFTVSKKSLLVNSYLQKKWKQKSYPFLSNIDKRYTHTNSDRCRQKAIIIINISSIGIHFSKVLP